MTAELSERYEAAQKTLGAHGQAQLLAFYSKLDDNGKAQLLTQIEAQDWAQLSTLIDSHVRQKPQLKLPEGIEPAPYYPLQPGSDLKEKYAEARKLGESLLREGKVAAFTVAGGQGTRLGWNGPKGTFPATPLTGKPLFQVFAEFLLKVAQKYGRSAPWYIMTSPINDAATRAFFEEQGYFGLERENVMFFPQGTLPSISLEGKVLLAAGGELALNPDGHGGSLKALAKSGALDDMARRGVTQISYFQVDNPNVKCLDPLFIGLHVLDEAEMSSKMLPKRGPLEKVGNFCLIDGRVNVIEYSDMPESLAKAQQDDGSLTFKAGSIAIHVIATDFVRKLNDKGQFGLPYHRAEKKVSHLDPESGNTIEPEGINAVKLEAFVFDALPLAERSILLETDRVEEFAPIKNASGEDSPESSKALQSLRAARWLASQGVAVPLQADSVDATIELSHLTAIEPEDLKDADLPPRIEAGSEVLF